MSTSTALTANTREDWLKLRSTGIGSSQAATILDLNPYKSRYALAVEMMCLVEPDDLSENEAVQMGILLEEPVASVYVKKTGRKIHDPGRYTVRRSEQYPWMLATLDREILPIDNRGTGILEIKTAGAAHADEWEEDAPVGYQAQLMHQMVVTGYRWGSLAVLIGGQKFKWIDIEYNPDFAELLIDEERKFWEMVRSGELPEADEQYSTRRAIEKLYPREQIETVALPAEAAEWAKRRAELKDQVRKCETELAGLENRIKAAIGKAGAGLLPDGSGFSWKLQRRAEHVVPAAEFRVLREIKGART